MIVRTLQLLEVVLFMTIGSVAALRLSYDQIQILKRKVKVETFGEKFHVSNVTFACNQSNEIDTRNMLRDLANFDESIPLRQVAQLAEEDMQYLMRFKGGTFIPEYLADNQKSANNNFPDAKMMRFKGLIKWSNRPFNNFPRGGPQSGRKIQGHARENGKPRIKGSSLASINHQQAEKLFQPISPLGDRKRKIFIGRRKRDVGSLFPTDDNSKAQDNTRIDENCSDAGQPSEYDPNLLHLCQICSAKRLLPAGRYPKVINEVFCKPPEGGCLGNGNGKCVPTMFNVHILKKRDDICRLCVKDTEALAVNEWDVYMEPVSVGCECMLDKNSDYRKEWFTAMKSVDPIG